MGGTGTAILGTIAGAVFGSKAQDKVGLPADK